MGISLKSFCEGTSIHGLAELYKTKSVIWKIFWGLVISSFVAVTGYQVYKSVNQYVYQEPSTIYVPAVENNLITQTVTFCLPHWLTWFNRDFSVFATFPNESTILYALSFLTPIYRTNVFNETVAENDLRILLKTNNLTLNEFFVKISLDIPTIPAKFFDKKELIYLNNMYQMCYTANESKVNSLLDNTKKLSFKIRKYSSNLYLTSNFVTAYEYSRYVNTFCKHFELLCIANHLVDANQINWDNVEFPNFLIAEKYNNLNFKMSTSVSEYSANLKVTQHNFRNFGSQTRACVEDKDALFSDQSCNEQCLTIEKANNTAHGCTPIEVSLFYDKPLSVDTTCRNNITWVDPEVHIVEAFLPKEKLPASERVISCSTNCSSGCNKFYFDLSMSSGTTMQSDQLSITTTATTINIKYPTVEDMVIMIESDSKTWEDFVGTVGGLLGVWTGASMMSIIQMMYLCCFSSPDKPSTIQVNDSNYSSNRRLRKWYR